MNKRTEKTKQIENQIEKALWDFEVRDKLDEALNVYQEAEVELEALGITADDPEHTEQQRVLAYCLMRQGNILRQKGKMQEAALLGEREIAAARACGDEITLARALMSNGTNLIVAGEIERGLKLIEDCRKLVENGDSYDHKQMSGWYWILQADLANAGLVKKEPAEIISNANHALDLLMPIENWPGVARAYAARATAHEKLGEVEEAKKDRAEQKIYENKVKPREESNT